MSKLKEVLERRLAAVGEKLEALTKEEPAEVKALKQELADVERISDQLNISCVENLAEEDQGLCVKLGIRGRRDCRVAYMAIAAELKGLDINGCVGMDMLKTEQAKIKEILPFIDVVERAFADYLPLAKEVLAEVEPQLVEVITLVCGDLLAKTYLDVLERSQQKYSERAATLWAGGLKAKREALLEAGFNRAEALQILLATSGNSLMGSVTSTMKAAGNLRKSKDSGAR